MEIITIGKWGKDHWSTLAYLETRVVDHNGLINNQHMRCDPRLHRELDHSASYGKNYPTRLKTGEIENHDDWSCVEDFVVTGLVEGDFNSSRVKVKLTEKGLRVCNQLRNHKARGGNYGDFELST